MRSIIRGIVALFAAFCMMDAAKAAPTIVSPADYATVKTMTDEMHSFLYSDAMLDPDTFTYTQTEYIAEDNEYRYVVTDARKAYMAEYNSNTIPVVFKWSAATDHSGDYTVTVKRVKDGKTVFTQTTSSTTVTFYDPEVGRNYIWTVTDNTGSATGHFYTDRRGPRIIYSETSDLTNTRDLGGWSTTDGKVVKQGLIYRAPEWEWSARQKTDTGNYFEMPYLRDVLGIKLEVDLRAKDSNTGSGVTGQTYIDYFKCGSVYESTIDSSIPRFFCEHAGSTVAFPDYGGFNSSAANRIAIWHTFTNFCDVVKADGTTKPVIFHCSHGKDRTGSLAYVLLGVLGVPLDSIERDWALSWYSEGKYDVYMNSNGPSKTVNTANSWLLDKLTTEINKYSGSTLKDKCYNYLLACATSASVSEDNAKALIDNYISIMLEEPETAAVNPNPDAPQPPEVEEPEVEVDEFVYTDYYFRGFGSFNSYYRWYKDLNQSSVCKDGFSPISYNYRIFIQPNATETQALGVYSRNATGDMAIRTGMIVCDASKRSPDGLVGVYDCPFYFSSEGHTVSERCIFEHRAGRSEWTGVHFYFVDPYNTSKSVYDGLASFDVWGGSTLCISGFISKSPNKTYLKFPADNCDNARVEVFYDDKENYSTLGWFTGGSESTMQYFQVTNAFMQFTTSGKVNGVAGALGLEFGLGELNKTTTDPLLKITGTFKVNPGSTITVNAGGKSAGTYKLISAGTLNDGADLVKNSSVENCASGHYGVVTKSGNNINLVVIKGTPPSTGDTVIDPTVYGSADTSSSTYTWRGYTGPWAYTTNWTASASANYGIPNNGTYATADFPATLENAFTCTLNKNCSVKYAKFDAPNMTLVIDNAALTVKDRAIPDDYLAYGFGTGDNANATLEFRGASAGIVSSKSEGRCMFGLEKSATDKLRCTIRFIVPASGWESTAPIRATGGDCSVYFWYDAKLVIDATALGVPAENEVKTALLATATDGMYNLAKVEITCADGAKGSVAVDGAKLVLTVEADETTEPEEPQLTAVDAPVAQAGLVYTGSELTGVVASEGYTLTGNTATDAGEYTATATLAEGYKWSDGTIVNKEISWSIAKATNEWTTEPSISLTEWTQGDEAGVLTAGVAKFGEVTSSMTELPTEVGSYTITYTVAENNNYNGLTKTIAFEIKAAVVVEPDPEEPGTGGEEPSEKPKLAIDAKFGYVLTGLGELGDQAIVVFTNSTEAATWKAPRNLKNVEFLAVGGGGGGGGAVNGGANNKRQGGAGGGGGGVVIGFIKDISANATVSVTVGNGGPGGAGSTSATTGAGAPTSNSSSSVITIDNVMYITAPGGGSGGGYNKAAIATGGSNSGGTKSSTDTALKSVTYVGADAASNISNAQLLRNKGGMSYTSSSGYSSAGGGGGASEAGISAGASSYGGRGGFGYVSYITGERVVYGAGGGGGVGKSGGAGTYIEDEEHQFVEGAGLGGVGTANGSAGLANQGGGGGGGSYGKNGGAGGSGIVVLRFAYSENDIPVDASVDILPLISDKVYTGEVLSSGLVETYAYTVEELKECVNVGAKVVRATLNEGYVWADGTTERYKDFPWNILKQDKNVWVTAPFINVESWGQTYTGNVIFHQADPLLGELIATIAKDDGEAQPFNGVLPSEPGTYKLIYKVDGTDNFSSLYWEKTFKIYESETFAGGYKVYGLGDNGDEVAVVFTSTTEWTVPQNVKNVEFLVVGGGGGGGADTDTDGEYQGGAGGGGGGVITGVIKEFSANSTVTITVGAGGKAGDNGIDNSGFGAGSTGEESSIALGTTKIVTAKGGGRDAGAAESGKYTDGNDGDAGGSGGGGRPNKAGGAADAGSVDETYVLSSQKYANAGGDGCTVPNSGYGCGAAGGGGGATEVGGNGTKVDAYKGGDGGEGLASDITGALLVYGSGGGGSSTWGSAGVGGTGAGDGVFEGKGKNAIANQGGGGGGGSRNGDGGAGGSGIVVFRYVVAPESPTVDGTDYAADEVFKAAKVSKPITYPGNPEVTTNTVDGVVTITFGGVPAQVPAYYNVTKVEGNGGYQIVLAIKDEFKNPVIANSENEDGSITPAIKVEGGKVMIHLEGDQFSGELYYIFKKGGDLTARGAWEVCNMTTETGDVQFDLNANDTAGFFEFIKVSDERITE